MTNTSIDFAAPAFSADRKTYEHAIDAFAAVEKVLSQPAQTVADEAKLWDEFLAAMERIRPIEKRHAGMLRAVKKYRLLGES